MAEKRNEEYLKVQDICFLSTRNEDGIVNQLMCDLSVLVESKIHQILDYPASSKPLCAQLSGLGNIRTAHTHL